MRKAFQAWGTWTMGLLVSGYVALFSWLSIIKQTSGHATSYDLAIFMRAVWGIQHGDMRIPLMGEVNFWSIYLTPLLAPVAQVCRFVPTLPFLLILQSTALAATAWLVFCWAKQALGPWLGLAIGSAVLLHPALQNANLFEFHMNALTLPFIVLFLRFHQQDRVASAAIAVCTVMVLREELAGVVLVYGIVLLARRRKAGLALIPLAFAWVGVALLVKSAHPNTWQVLAQSVDVARSGMAGYLAVLAGKIPTLLIAAAGFAFLPLLKWRTLSWAILPLGYYFFSPNPVFGRIDFHYFSLFVPFLAVATLKALEGGSSASGFSSKLSRWVRPRHAAVAVVLIVAAAVNSRAFSLAPWGRVARPFEYRNDTYTHEARQVVGLIKPDASVAAPIGLLHALSERQWIYSGVFAGPDVVVLDRQPERGVGESVVRYQQRLNSVAAIVDDMQQRFGYQTGFSGQRLILLQSTR